MSFAQLLREVENVEGLERIRFMTPHPKDLSDELIEVMATSKKVCKHMHLPMQSGSSRLLKLMNRHYTKEQYVALAKKIQERIPGVSFTTDIIVGFPGETEEDFEETLDVVREVGFDSAYTYVYSKRSGTPAASRSPAPRSPSSSPRSPARPAFRATCTARAAPPPSPRSTTPDSTTSHSAIRTATP